MGLVDIVELANVYFKSGDYDAALKVVESGIGRSAKTKNIALQMELYIEKLFILLRLHNMSELESVAKILIKNVKYVNEKRVLSKLYHAYALYLFYTNKTAISIKYLRKALKIAKKTDEKQLESEILNSIGKYFDHFNDFQNAIYYYKKSEKTKILLDDENGLAIVYGNLGRLFYQNGDLEEALNHYNLDLKISKRVNDKFGQAIMHNHIGEIYLERHHYQKALSHFKNSHAIGIEMNYELNNGFSLLGMAKIHIVNKEYEKAKENVKNAVKIFNDKTKYDGLINCLLLMGKIYMYQNEIKNAEEYFIKAYALASSKNMIYETGISLYELAKFYITTNQVEKSLDYINKYFQINFNISNFENTMFKHVINLAKLITKAENIMVLIKRENTVEFIYVENDREGNERIKRQVISSWDELLNNYIDENNDLIKSLLEIKLNVHIKDFILEPVYFTSRIIAFMFAFNSSKEKTFDENTKDYIAVYNIKLANLIQSVVSYELSKYDPLTRASNRNTLFSDIQEEIFKTILYKEPFSILMVDIDNFKDINDSFGHQLGDLTLIKVVESIKNSIRDKNKIYRFGGDEFIVMLPTVSVNAAVPIANRIIQSIRSINSVYQVKGINITASIGITEYNGKNSATVKNDVEAILRKADQAMYQAKIKGKDRVEIIT
ncbi:MAG: diguanylate cyclase [Proteobacteria bacterium]|nr:diguanylate cyclase [Pseudomonadota bacterium]